MPEGREGGCEDVRQGEGVFRVPRPGFRVSLAWLFFFVSMSCGQRVSLCYATLSMKRVVGGV